MKVTVSREDLERFYIEEKHSYAETTEHFKLTAGQLDRLLREYNLRKTGRTTGMLDQISKEDVRKLYIVQNLSMQETAGRLSITGPQLRKLLKKFGIVKDRSLVREVSRRTSLEKYGVESPNQSEEVKVLKKQRMLERYGVDNPMQIPEVREIALQKLTSPEMKQKRAEALRNRTGEQKQEQVRKAQQTCLERYGENYSTLFRQKSRDTLVEKYGVPYSVPGHEKARQTCLERYGTEHYWQTDEGKERVRDAKFEKYGGYFNLYKVKQTKLERYGDENYNNRGRAKSTMLEKYGTENYLQICPKKHSGPEERVRRLLGGETCHIKGREFDIRVGNVLVEVDGEYWHPDKPENLSISQVRSLTNDHIKEQLAQEEGLELIRVHVKDIPEKDEDVTLENLRKFNYRPDLHISFDTELVTVATMRKTLEHYGIDSVREMVGKSMLDLVWTCQPDFPEIPREENLQDVIEKLRTSGSDYYSQNGCFTFNSSNVGNNVIKSRFRSFWESSNTGKMSPVEVWHNPALMQSIVDYRVGFNETGECFGLSLKQLVRGLNVNHYLVSFFKPSLAAAIYRHYLGNVERPAVFDPSAGFGARLLAFKSLYPDGTYIGCEPNPRTFAELEALVREAGFTGVVLHNCKFEDLEEIPTYDLGFTSPPYFDLENYRNGVSYASFEDWVDKFWNKLVNLPNMYLNINWGLYDRLADPKLEVVDTIRKNRNPVSSHTSDSEPIVRRNLA